MPYSLKITVYSPRPRSDKLDAILKLSEPTPGSRGNIDQSLLLREIWISSDIASNVLKDSEYFILLALMAAWRSVTLCFCCCNICGFW